MTDAITYELVGFYRPGGCAPSGVIPIFTESKDVPERRMYFQRIGEAGEIVEFCPIRSELLADLIEVIVEIPVRKCVQKPAVLAYEVDDKRLIFGTDEEMRQALAKALQSDLLDGHPFARLEVARYLEDEELITDCSVACVSLLNASGHGLVDAWVRNLDVPDRAREAVRSRVLQMASSMPLYGLEGYKRETNLSTVQQEKRFILDPSIWIQSDSALYDLWNDIEKNPRESRSWKRLIRRLMRNKMYREGLHISGASIEEFPGEPYFLYMMAQFLKKSGSFEVAEEVFGDIVHRFPSYVEGYIALVNFYDARGQFEEAKSVAKKAVVSCPGDARSWGLLVRYASNDADMMLAYDHLISEFKEDYRHWIRYADYLRGKGKVAAAIDLLNRAKLIHPNVADVYLRQSFMLSSLGRLQEAKEILDIGLGKCQGKRTRRQLSKRLKWLVKQEPLTLLK